MAERVLIVDDEKNLTLVVQAMLERDGFEPLVFNDSTAALKAIQSESLSAVVTDLYMPGPGGMEILEFCKQERPRLPVVIMTAYGTVEAAVAALKKGAFDFVTKPFDQSELLNVVRKAVSTFARQEKELALGSAPGISSMVGNSPQIQDVFKVIGKIASSPSTVLIHGESGTGKELVAFEIHRNSQRASKPFIKINCAAIPATLIESELFGYEKGAFTGATTTKPGRFELAHGGTLFLDEIGEMPLEMQVKLLRALQEQEFEHVGGIQTVQVDVRIIAATNRDLQHEVANGRFREDLFYRLNVVPIQLPPLRERQEDIEALVRYFLAQFNEKLGKAIRDIDPSCLETLRAYSWPGNIRQLENTIERMVLMADGSTLVERDLPLEVQREKFGVDVKAQVEMDEGGRFKEIVKRQTQSIERGLIEKALDETQGNVTKAAEKLGLSRKGLQLKLKELGLKRSGD